MKNRKKILGLSIGIITAFCILAVCIMATTEDTSPKSKKSLESVKTKPADTSKVKVVVSRVKEGTFEDWGSYSADLRGIEDAYLTAPFQGGRVNSIKPVGTRVWAGQSLCDIDSVKYEAALQAAQAQVEVARGELDRATANVDKGSIGRSALSAANLGYQNARMLLATAQRAYEDCRCQAPFNGILVSHNIQKFQTVAPGVPTVRISRIDQLEAVISIPETEAFSYEEGMRSEFRLLQNPNQEYKGNLKSLDRAIDSRSRTVTARIIIGNADGTLKPGMVGRVKILRKTFQSAIVIPSTALLHLQNGVAVMVVKNGIAKQHSVEVGATNSEQALITSGLEPGELLIVAGAFQVSDGTRVSP